VYLPRMSLTYTGGTLDRAGAHRKDEAWVDAQRARADAWVVPSWQDRVFVRRAADGAAAPLLIAPVVASAASPPERWILLGLHEHDGAPVFAAEVEEPAAAAIAAASPGSEIAELRRVAS